VSKKLSADTEGQAEPFAVKVPTRPPHLAFIVYFRAIGILLIVAGHSYALGGIRLGSGFDNTLSNLIKGATALFVFMSGFVFDYVFSARYGYRSFVLDRAKKLLIPYSLLTAGFVFSNWTPAVQSAEQLFRYFAIGDAFQAYWYIPFIMLMFAFSPLHRLFMDLRTSQQIAIIVGAAIVSGLVQRPVSNDNALQSVIFFMPVYLSGIFLSLHRKTLLPALQKRWPTLLLTAVLLAIVQSARGQSDNMHKPFFAFGGFDLMVFQKLVLALALAGLFAKLPSPPSRVVSVVADTSFAIFFLHPFVLKIIGDTAVFQLTHIPWIDLSIAVSAIVTLCALIALTLRIVLKAESKYITGY
jgi:hypothetical protein